jgi:hypothetical protein
VKKALVVAALAIVAGGLAFAQCECAPVKVECPSCYTAVDEEAIGIKASVYPSASGGVSYGRGVGLLCWYEYRNCWCNAGRLCCEVYICWYDAHHPKTACQRSGRYECFGSCDEPIPVHNPIMI